MNSLSQYSFEHKKIQKGLLVLVFFIFMIGNIAKSDAIDDFLNYQILERKIPGLQIAIIKNNQIVKLGNYGVANLEDNVAVTENTVFTINSMTKAFVGVAVMQLVEQGKINLSESPSKYLPDLPEIWNNVTIKQLLTHTSGLPEIMDYDGNLISKESEEAAWQLVQKKPLEFQPNTEFRYNNTNYLLLGKIITKVSGEHFENYIKQQQLEKVNMPRTIEAGFTHTEKTISDQASNYIYNKTGSLTIVHEKFPAFLHTTAGMSSNAKEMARWIIALQGGQLLKSSSLKTLWKPATLDNGQTKGFNKYLNGYALGWPIVDRSLHPAIASAGGDRALLMIYTNDNLSIVVLSNLIAGIPVGETPDILLDEIAAFYIPQLENLNKD